MVVNDRLNALITSIVILSGVIRINYQNDNARGSRLRSQDH